MQELRSKRPTHVGMDPAHLWALATPKQVCYRHYSCNRCRIHSQFHHLLVSSASFMEDLQARTERQEPSPAKRLLFRVSPEMPAVARACKAHVFAQFLFYCRDVSHWKRIAGCTKKPLRSTLQKLSPDCATVYPSTHSREQSLEGDQITRQQRLIQIRENAKTITEIKN